MIRGLSALVVCILLAVPSIAAAQFWTDSQTGNTWTTDPQVCGPRAQFEGESWVAIQTWTNPQTGNVWTTDPRATGSPFVGWGCSWVEILVWVNPQTGATWTTDPNPVGPTWTGSGHTWTNITPAPPPPPPPGGEFIPLGVSGATGVSDDGRVVVGNSGREAYRWTAATGPVALGGLPGRTSAEAVSADGTTVVGWFQAGSLGRIEAFHWNTATGAVGLGDLIGDEFQSESFDVSADGSVVVGTAVAAGAEPGQGSRHLEAFRWTAATGMVGLGDLQGGNYWSDARGVSADGSVVVGWSYNTSFTPEAMRWTSATGMVGLGDLPDGGSDSRGLDVSDDGSVIVGSGSGASGTEAVYWTSAGGMIGLGYLPGGLESWAHSVSADGSVVVGESGSASGATAFVWTQSDGMQSLRDVLIARGVTGLDDWVLSNATGVSADGQWVVGGGTNPSGFGEAFLANIPAP